MHLINNHLCTFVLPFSADLKLGAGSLGVADRESGKTEKGKRLKETERRTMSCKEKEKGIGERERGRRGNAKRRRERKSDERKKKYKERNKDKKKE